MPGVVGRLARRLNWMRRGWSTAQDRAFHDAVFAGQAFDPFSPSYPGFLTIRRFADLAEPHVRPSDSVVDLGCGPGEITCEMARRAPSSQVLGVDHSAEALDRARRLASDLGLTNVTFDCQDLERYVPPHPVGLVTMFDAFHHLLDPSGFVRRVGRFSDRFFLIEPAGNWLGQWQKSLDLDWLAGALLVIGDRLEYQFGVTTGAERRPAPPSPTGEPTEHRYSIEDFLGWFDGYGVDIRGTVAGLEQYGIAPYARSPLRDDVGRIIYNLVVDLEAMLRRADLDLAAKHWAIYAERGRTFSARSLPDVPDRLVQRPLAGPYDCEYSAFEGPLEGRPGEILAATVRVGNHSWRVWDSAAGETPVFLSYHWLDRTGATIVEDGLRSPLPRPIAPGGSATVSMRLQCPAERGRYTLAVDLVHEQVTWFSRAGVPPLSVAFRVR